MVRLILIRVIKKKLELEILILVKIYFKVVSVYNF